MHLLLAAVSLIWALTATESAPNNIGDKRVVCYYGSWAQYRWGPAQFNENNVQCGLCTHFIYTFAGLNDATADIIWLDTYGDIGDGDWKKEGSFQKIQRQCQTENTKMMVAIGGWNEGSEKYSRVIRNPTTRATLVNNIISFVKKWNLDGFDIDWEYPNQRGGVPEDKDAYTAFVQALHEKLAPEGKLLSAAVSANAKLLSQSYDIPVVSKYLDFINVMAYDLHGSWEDFTGHHAALWPGPHDSADEQHLNVAAAVNGWLEEGAPAQKLNLGLAAYGRAFALTNPNVNGIGAPARGAPPTGWIPEDGFFGYNELCFNNGSVWKTYWDVEQEVPYAVSGKSWVGFDDVASFRAKACFAKKLDLGGLMLWTIETDDFRGNCGQGSYPLLRTMISSLADSTCGPTIGQPPVGPPEVTTTTTTAPSSSTAAPQPSTSAPQPSTSAPIEPILPPSYTEAPQTQAPVTTTPTPTDQESVENSDSAGVQCSSPGEMIGDPINLQTFYVCAPGATGEKAVPLPFICPPGLVFDRSIRGCNWG